MSETYRVGAPPAVPTPAPKRQVPLVLIAVVTAVVVGVGGGAGWLLLRDGDITITGTVEIGDGGFEMVAGGNCRGKGGFGDLGPGAQVVVTDSGGETVGVGRLEPGSWVGARCELPFTVDVPAGSDFYGLQVSGRNVVQYEAKRLTQPVVLTINA